MLVGTNSLLYSPIEQLKTGLNVCINDKRRLRTLLVLVKLVMRLFEFRIKNILNIKLS